MMKYSLHICALLVSASASALPAKSATTKLVCDRTAAEASIVSAAKKIEGITAVYFNDDSNLGPNLDDPTLCDFSGMLVMIRKDGYAFQAVGVAHQDTVAGSFNGSVLFDKAHSVQRYHKAAP